MKCKATVYGRTAFDMHQCYKNEWKDGYCKIHHPEEKAKRNKARNEKYEREYEREYNERVLRQDKEQDELWARLLKELPQICLYAPDNEPERHNHIVEKLKQLFKISKQ